MIRRELFKTALGAIAGWFGMSVDSRQKGRPTKPAVGQVWVDKVRGFSFGFVYVLLHDYPSDDGLKGWTAAQWHVGRNPADGHEWLYFYNVVRVMPVRSWQYAGDFQAGCELVRNMCA